MSVPTDDMFEFYRQHGQMSDPGEHVDLFDGLPSDLDSLCDVVQTNLLHVFWAERYGRRLTEENEKSLYIRNLTEKLALIRQIDDSALVNERPLGKRQIGNCRDFTLMMTAFLRHQGVVARARCGFGAYFMTNQYEDHWVCEYWNEEQNRWILVDSQLDKIQRKTLKIDFDPLDVPRDQFIIAGKAWEMCRSGQAEPKEFGIFDMRGWWFIWGDVVRDFLALNKVNILPWDHELEVFKYQLDDPLTQDPDELAFYDRIAALTLAGDHAFHEIRREIKESCWRIPDDW